MRTWPECCNNPQSCACRSLRIILVGYWVAEVDQQAIAEILGNMPFIAFDHRRTRLLISTDYVAQLFGVELLGERGRADQVAEHDGELPALGCE